MRSISEALGYLATSIRRRIYRRPSAHALLRQVIDETNLDHFCTCAADEDDDHGPSCLTLELAEWARDYPPPAREPVEYIAQPPRPAPAPEPPLTPEERAEQEARMNQFVETVNHLREAYSRHMDGGGPANIENSALLMLLSGRSDKKDAEGKE